MMKMRQFIGVGEALGKMFGPIAAQAANFEEVAKELFGLAGYKDGDRFIKQGFDPQVAMLQQELQKLKAGQKAPAAGAPQGPSPLELQETMAENASKEKIEGMKAQTAITVAKINADNDLATERMDTQRELLRMAHDGQQSAVQRAHDAANTVHPAMQGFR
jgi:hypothetical protein